jgi:hypothetical protein
MGVSMSRQQQNKEKEQHWRKMIWQAALSDMSISEFCRRHGLKEKQFYWWRHHNSCQSRLCLFVDNNSDSDSLTSILCGQRYYLDYPNEPGNDGCCLVFNCTA